MARTVPHKTFRAAAEDQFAFLDQRFGEPTFNDGNTCSLIYDNERLRVNVFLGGGDVSTTVSPPMTHPTAVGIEVAAKPPPHTLATLSLVWTGIKTRDTRGGSRAARAHGCGPSA
jgi:hypothetical protein